MKDDNIKVVEAFFAALNAHDTAQLDRLRAEGFAGATTAGSMGANQIKQYDTTVITAFPDIFFEITLTIAQGDYVVVHWNATGTHNGPLSTPGGNSLPPTGKRVRWPGSHTFEISNGKVLRNWFFTDTAYILAQLGLMPAMLSP